VAGETVTRAAPYRRTIASARCANCTGRGDISARWAAQDLAIAP
jgi:hypothetical protein